MKRRDALAAFIASSAAPVAVFSQSSGKVWRIGFLSLGSVPGPGGEAFREQLQSLGWVEGRNLLIEYRFAARKDERLAEMAAELVRLKVDVIVAVTSRATSEAMRASSTIPIVMAADPDPVGSGHVASLANPGGNVTGTSLMSTDLAGKRLQLLHELLPKVTRVALLVLKRTGGVAPLASNPTSLMIEQAQAAAQKLGIKLVVQEVGEAGELAGVFAAMQRERTQALVVQESPFTFGRRQQIVELAAQQRLPTMFEPRDFVVAGGLMSYGPNISEIFRRTALYVDKIFKGAKPADLPVELPTRFEMAINLKTAKAFGLTVPYTIRLQATEVIE